MNVQPLATPGADDAALPAHRRHQLVPADGYLPDYDLEPDGLDLGTIWRVLWERKYLILAAAGVGLALALIFSLLQTPLYRSTATLELNPPTMPILTSGSSGSDSGGQNMVVPQTDFDFLATQYGLLKSKALAAHVVEDLNLAARGGGSGDQTGQQRIKQLSDKLSANLAVDPVPQSRLVRLTYTSEGPADAAKVVNGFATAFINSTLERRYAAAASARKFLEDRLAAVRNDLDQSEKKVVEYAQANGIITTGDASEGPQSHTSSSLQGASLDSLNDALSQAQQARIEAEQRYRKMANVASTSEVSERTAALRSERATVQAEYDEKSTYLKDDYPDMVRLRSKLQAYDQAIANEAGNVSGSRANTLRSEYQAALAAEQSLQAKVNQLKGSVLDLRALSIQYNILKRQADTNRSLYQALLSRYNEIGVAGGIDTPQASLVDSGEVPDSPFSPNVPRNLALGLLLGLVAGAGLAFALYYITDRISTPDDVREKLRLPPIGVIPRLKRKEELAEVIADRKSPISEAYASLVTTLQFTTSEGLPRALLITSTIAEEGKSTTSFVVARMMAQHGMRTLLIDADLRKPSFVVEESVDTGLSQLVIDGSELQRHIIKTSEDNLWLMPSGPMPPNPVQVLNSDRARRVVRQARELFDCVIVDAPPSFGFADAPLLAAMCDAVLLVVESGRTRRRPAIEAIERLRAAGALIIGANLTKYKFDTSEYGYRYYEAYDENRVALRPHELAVGLIKRSET
jgi:capsular exopolysaccharide synthesis family protein